jgi:hypothetical protein
MRYIFSRNRDVYLSAAKVPNGGYLFQLRKIVAHGIWQHDRYETSTRCHFAVAPVRIRGYYAMDPVLFGMECIIRRFIPDYQENQQRGGYAYR